MRQTRMNVNNSGSTYLQSIEKLHLFRLRAGCRQVGTTCYFVSGFRVDITIKASSSM